MKDDFDDDFDEANKAFNRLVASLPVWKEVLELGLVLLRQRIPPGPELLETLRCCEHQQEHAHLDYYLDLVKEECEELLHPTQNIIH